MGSYSSKLPFASDSVTENNVMTEKKSEETKDPSIVDNKIEITETKKDICVTAKETIDKYTTQYVKEVIQKNLDKILEGLKSNKVIVMPDLIALDNLTLEQMREITVYARIHFITRIGEKQSEYSCKELDSVADWINVRITYPPLQKKEQCNARVGWTLDTLTEIEKLVEKYIIPPQIGKNGIYDYLIITNTRRYISRLRDTMISMAEDYEEALIKLYKGEIDYDEKEGNIIDYQREFCDKLEKIILKNSLHSPGITIKTPDSPQYSGELEVSDVCFKDFVMYLANYFGNRVVLS